MNWIVQIVVFFVGMAFGMHWLAALFSWIDLRYNLRAYWLIALKKTVFWSAGAAAIIYFLPFARIPAFVAGVIAVGLVYYGYHLWFNYILKNNRPRAEAAEGKAGR